MVLSYFLCVGAKGPGWQALTRSYRHELKLIGGWTGAWSAVYDITGQMHNGRPVYKNRNMQVTLDMSRRNPSDRFIYVRMYLFMNSDNKWTIKKEERRGADTSFHREAITSKQHNFEAKLTLNLVATTHTHPSYFSLFPGLS